MHTASIIYKALILPVIDYCDTVWNCCGRTNTDKIKKLQRRAVRKILQPDSSDDGLERLGYETLKFRRETHTVKLVKTCSNKLCPQFLVDYFYFNRDILQKKTRQSNHLRLPSVKLECTKKAFYYHGCVLFNRNL